MLHRRRHLGNSLLPLSANASWGEERSKCLIVGREKGLASSSLQDLFLVKCINQSQISGIVPFNTEIVINIVAQPVWFFVVIDITIVARRQQEARESHPQFQQGEFSYAFHLADI